METTRAERIKIGAFMLLCGIMICVFLGYVLSRFLNKEFDNYYTVFSESVIGLYKDAQVKLNGIDVGNVTEIAIDSSNLSQVIVRFRVNKGTPIKLGTRAGMTHGISLTGEKQMNRTSPKAVSFPPKKRRSTLSPTRRPTSLATSIP